MTIQVETMYAFTDGSGISALVQAYGVRFSVNIGSAEKITVYPLTSPEYRISARTRAIRRSAMDKVEAFARGVVDSMGPKWHHMNAEIYKGAAS